MLKFDQVALEEAAEQFRQSIPLFLAVPRTKGQIPKHYTQAQRDKLITEWAKNSELPRKQQEPRQIPLSPAEQMQPMTEQRALETLEFMLTGVYQQTQVQQLCFNVGRRAYPRYTNADDISAYKIMGIGACLFRALNEFCTQDGWERRKVISEAEGDVAGYTKTWISAPTDYFQRITAGSKDALKGFLAPSQVEPWTVDNIYTNRFINTRSPESDWVLKHMTGGRSLELALKAANINQQAQYRLNDELYIKWHGRTSLDDHSPIEERSRAQNYERMAAIKGPVSFRYTADSRLRLYAADTMSPQAGKTRTYFWEPCDVNGQEIKTEMLDNTGSGFQIMSCIALDETSARYSNLLPNDGEARDIYVLISQEALRFLSPTHPVSKLNLRERDSRTLKKISKTASMAMLYGGGVTHYSRDLVDFLGDELPDLTPEQKRAVEKAFDKALTQLFPYLRAR